MIHRNTAFALVLLLSGLAAAAGKPGIEIPTVTTLRDGFVFVGVQGTVRVTDANDLCSFIPDVDMTDGRATLPARTAIELLRCGTLEQMLGALDKDRPTLHVWLTGRVTLYNNRNFIYPVRFIPVELRTEEGPPDARPKVVRGFDPNEPSILPEDVRKRLRPDTVMDLTRLSKLVDVEHDVALVNRTGFVTVVGDRSNLAIDAIGRNVEHISFRLLPNTVLQNTETAVRAAPGAVRFRVAGIVTRYRGSYYLLLQRAVRTYSHGNFNR